MWMVSGPQTNLVSVFLSAEPPPPPQGNCLSTGAFEKELGETDSPRRRRPGVWKGGGGVKDCGERVPGKALALEDPLTGRISPGRNPRYLEV